MLPSRARAQMREHALGQPLAHAAPLHGGERVLIASGVGAEGTGPDHVDAIARYVAHHQQLDARTGGAQRQTPAREGSQVLAHAVQLLDLRSGGEQRPRRGGQIGEAEPRRRTREQAGGASREQHQQHVLAARGFDQRHRLARGALAARIGNRVRRLEEARARKRSAVTVLGDGETGGDAIAGDGLHRGGHRRGGLAHREHHEAARLRQVFSGQAQARPLADQRAAHRGARVHRGERRAKTAFESGPGAVARIHGAALASGGAGSAGGDASAGGGRAGSSAISIRRFFWRPSGVSLVAIGRYSP